MTSVRQLEANRRNALKSTGPRSEAGKRVSRRNALRHGFTAETVIEPLENPQEYRSFEEAIVSEYLPQTPVEREWFIGSHRSSGDSAGTPRLRPGCCGRRAKLSSHSGPLAQMQPSSQK